MVDRKGNAHAHGHRPAHSHAAHHHKAAHKAPPRKESPPVERRASPVRLERNERLVVINADLDGYLNRLRSVEKSESFLRRFIKKIKARKKMPQEQFVAMEAKEPIDDDDDDDMQPTMTAEQPKLASPSTKKPGLFSRLWPFSKKEEYDEEDAEHAQPVESEAVIRAKVSRMLAEKEDEHFEEKTAVIVEKVVQEPIAKPVQRSMVSEQPKANPISATAARERQAPTTQTKERAMPATQRSMSTPSPKKEEPSKKPYIVEEVDAEPEADDDLDMDVAAVKRTHAANVKRTLAAHSMEQHKETISKELDELDVKEEPPKNTLMDSLSSWIKGRKEEPAAAFEEAKLDDSPKKKDGDDHTPFDTTVDEFDRMQKEFEEIEGKKKT